MTRKTIALLLTLAYLNLLMGCSYKTSRILSDEIGKLRPTQTIVEVVLVTGEVITFSREGARYNPARREIVGRTADGKKAEVSVDAVLYLRVKQVDAEKVLIKSFAGILVVGLVVVAIAMAAKESCPFIYSNDGEMYVFDAEPLGGAVCKALTRTDLSRMEHLKPVGGEYKLIVRNEVEETQYLDQIKLLAVEHPAGTEVISDSSGQLWAIRSSRAPRAVRDENGADLSRFFADRDGISWQSHLPAVSRDTTGLLRHELTLTFDKTGADSVFLLVNAGTALWGSHMIREMLSLRGAGLESWYEGVNSHGQDLFDLINFTYREETYVLNLQVYRNGGWQTGKWLAGGGPLILEDGLIPLDASGTDGDSLRLRVMPPPGFWNIDYIGVVAGEPVKCAPLEMSLLSAEGLERGSLMEELQMIDGNYVEMPRVGDSFNLSFKATEAAPGMERALFLRSTGYYELHIDQSRPEQTEFIRTALNNPGTIARYAMEQYLNYSGMAMLGKTR